MERRNILRTAVFGAMAALVLEAGGCLVAFAWATRERDSRVFVGYPVDLRLGEPVRIAAGDMFVIRVPEGVLALSDRCTHLGCHVAWRADAASGDGLGARGRFDCPCHGAIYDRYGRVLSGPAPRPLDLVPLWLDGRALVADPRAVVRRASFQPGQVLPV